MYVNIEAQQQPPLSILAQSIIYFDYFEYETKKDLCRWHIADQRMISHQKKDKHTHFDVKPQNRVGVPSTKVCGWKLQVDLADLTRLSCTLFIFQFNLCVSISVNGFRLVRSCFFKFPCAVSLWWCSLSLVDQRCYWNCRKVSDFINPY